MPNGLPQSWHREVVIGKDTMLPASHRSPCGESTRSDGIRYRALVRAEVDGVESTAGTVSLCPSGARFRDPRRDWRVTVRIADTALVSDAETRELLRTQPVRSVKAHWRPKPAAYQCQSVRALVPVWRRHAAEDRHGGGLRARLVVGSRLVPGQARLLPRYVEDDDRFAVLALPEGGPHPASRRRRHLGTSEQGTAAHQTLRSTTSTALPRSCSVAGVSVIDVVDDPDDGYRLARRTDPEGNELNIYTMAIATRS